MSLAMNFVILFSLTFAQQCFARYSGGHLEEHETIPDIVQLFVQDSKDPLDEYALEDLRKEALTNGKMLVELGKQELRVLSKLTGTVIGADLLHGYHAGTYSSSVEEDHGATLTPTAQAEPNKVNNINENVNAKPNPSKTNPLSQDNLFNADDGVMYYALPVEAGPSAASTQFTEPVAPAQPSTATGSYNPLAGDPFHSSYSQQFSHSSPPSSGGDGSVNPLMYPVQYYSQNSLPQAQAAAQNTPSGAQGQPHFDNQWGW